MGSGKIKNSKTRPYVENEIMGDSKKKRKIDISLILSILALLVTTLQFVVTTPFFTDYYNKASFEIEETFPYLNEDRLLSSFVIKNTSENIVNDIDIGFQLLANDKVEITPTRNIQVTFKENGPTLKDCFFRIDKLVPNESVYVLIDSNFDTLMRYNKDFLKGGTVVQNELNPNKKNKIKTETQIENLVFPSVLIAKFEKGFGKIIRLPKEILLNHYNINTNKKSK